MRALLPLAALLLAGCLTPVPVELPGSALPGTVVAEAPPGSEWRQFPLDLEGSRFQAEEQWLTPERALALRPAWRVDLQGAATGTPIVADGRVVVADWSGNVTAVEAATGRVAWTYALGAKVTGSVALVEGGVFAVGGPWMVRLDAGTGEEVWRVTVDEEPGTHLYGSPLVHGGRVYMGISSDQHSVRLYPEPQPLTFRGSVVALDGATGDLVWRAWVQEPGSGLGGSVWTSPVMDPEGTTLYLGTGNAYTAPAGNRTDAMLAIDALTGDVRWSFQATRDDVWTQRNPENPDWDFGSSAVHWRAPDGQGLVVEAQKSGVVWAKDAATGAHRWHHGDFDGGAITASPAVKDGVLFLPYQADRVVKAIALADGKERWSRDLGAALFASPAVVPGLVLVGTSDGALVVLDEATGDEVARHATPGGIYGGVSVAGGRVYTTHVPKGFLGGEGALVAWAAG